MPASRAASARDSPSNAPAIACRRAAAARSFSRRASRRNSAAGTSSRIGRPFAPIASSPAGLDATRITSPRVASNHVRVRKSANRYDDGQPRLDAGFGRGGPVVIGAVLVADLGCAGCSLLSEVDAAGGGPNTWTPFALLALALLIALGFEFVNGFHDTA